MRSHSAWAWMLALLLASGCRSPAAEPAPKASAAALPLPKTDDRLGSAFDGVFPAVAPPFVAEAPLSFSPGFARRAYRAGGKRVEITVARMGSEPGAYEAWVASSASYPQAPLPQDRANGFFTCAGSDPAAGCDLHIQTRAGFHVEIMGDGHVPHADLLVFLGHVRLTDLSDSFPPL